MEDIGYFIQITGTGAFAVTAVLAVAPKGIDLFGACVMGIITAIGGGTVRDLILDVPVFWANELSYIWIALGASVATFWGQSVFAHTRLYKAMLYFDALGAALFATQATWKVWRLEFGLPIAPILLGIITAIGGGLIRDVLAGRSNLLMTRELYAIPVLCGTLLFVAILVFLPQHGHIGGLACFVLIFVLRAAAIHWSLTVPVWLTTKQRIKKARESSS
ncbi:MAG: TRIC cation channel family protein [Gammaproteobacteria bacterium]|nr:TRIC cation channel family protein [Gammaproteobacteria bacterium]MCP5458077.1 TRIC cation channel family protein [Gammaproteobacteria bacterium]